jgi:hypothetical protein
VGVESDLSRLWKEDIQLGPGSMGRRGRNGLVLALEEHVVCNNIPENCKYRGDELSEPNPLGLGQEVRSKLHQLFQFLT